MTTDVRDAAAEGVREEDKASLRECWLVFARRRYDEHPWIEMIVAPRDAMRTVIAS